MKAPVSTAFQNVSGLLLDYLNLNQPTQEQTKQFFAAILAVGMFTLSQTPSSNPAMADRNNNYNDHQIPRTVTIPLEGLRLKAGQFIELSDTTHLRVSCLPHVTINVPSQNGNNNKIQNLILQL